MIFLNVFIIIIIYSIFGPRPRRSLLPSAPRRSLLPSAPRRSLLPRPVVPFFLILQKYYLLAEWCYINILILEYITNMHCQCGRKSTA